jgi:hypothetical protein
LKLAPTILPRITEITGEDGSPLVVEISKEIAEKNDITPTTTSNSEGQAQVQGDKLRQEIRENYISG